MKTHNNNNKKMVGPLYFCDVIFELSSKIHVVVAFIQIYFVGYFWYSWKKKGGSHNNNNNNQKKRTHRQDFRCCYTHSISIFCFHLEILTSLSNKQQMFMQCEMICKWLSSIVSHLYSVLFYKHSCQA